jgi:thermolabile hemolysin
MQKMTSTQGNGWPTPSFATSKVRDPNREIAMKSSVMFFAALAVWFATQPDAMATTPVSLARPFALGADTTTYVRCHYRVDAHANLPEGAWTWARTPSGDYLSLRGRWAYASLESANLFFTDIPQGTLIDRCGETLRREGKGALLAATAADTLFSYDYGVWTNDAREVSPGITRMVIFGDSLSDSVNAWNRSLGLVPHRKSWSAGRFSNGAVWPEISSSLTGLDLINFAFGAAAADGNAIIPGVIQQVKTWRELRGKAGYVDDARNVYMMFIGGNDFINYGKQADEVLASVEIAARMLIDDGAEHIVLMNLPDISSAPEVRGTLHEAAVHGQVLAFNAGLEQLQARLSARTRVDVFDTYSHFAAILARPGDYRIENIRDGCLDIRGTGALVYAARHPVSQACKNADAYVFWDRLHPTRRVHAVLGEAVADFIASRSR